MNFISGRRPPGTALQREGRLSAACSMLRIYYSRHQCPVSGVVFGAKDAAALINPACCKIYGATSIMTSFRRRSGSVHGGL